MEKRWAAKLVRLLRPRFYSRLPVLVQYPALNVTAGVAVQGYFQTASGAVLHKIHPVPATGPNAFPISWISPLSSTMI